MDKEIIAVMKRYELKYILTKEQTIYFKEQIDRYMKIDKYGLTTISSIYYDTPNNYLVNRSIEKPAYKEKMKRLSIKEELPQPKIKLNVSSIVMKNSIIAKYLAN